MHLKILLCIILVLALAIGGALAYRNNQAKSEAFIANVGAAEQKLRSKF